MRRLLLALLPLLSACGSEDARQLRALLERGPDLVLEQVGELHAELEQGFGDHARHGWSATEVWNERALCWSASPRSSLRLSCVGAPSDALWLEATDSLGRSLSLRLNGVELGEVELEAEQLRRHELEVPEAAWVQGENVLEFSVERREEAGRWGLAAIGWGPARRVLHVEGALQLDPSTSVGWWLEGQGEGARLELDCQLDAGAGLRARLSRLDPDSGALETLRESALDSGSSAIELPATSAAPLLIELVSRGESAALLRDIGLSTPPRERPPSIVFVSIDTWAAAHTSLHGYERETTPHLEALALEGVLFTRCKANAPLTHQSYLSQLSGLYPLAHEFEPPESVVQNDTDVFDFGFETRRMTAERWTLAEALRAAGYRTAAFVDNPWLGGRFGFEQGFELYDTSATEITAWDTDGGMRHILPRVEAWLDGLEEDEPYFVFVQLLDLHAPYLPQEPWDASFAGDARWDEQHELQVGVGSATYWGLIPQVAARSLGDRPKGGERMRTAPLIDAYDQKMVEIDQFLHAFFQSLRARGQWESSAIVVSADHGESMLEHEYVFNHGTLYEESLHVPLLLKLPHGAQAGTRVESPVQLVDLYPTFLELAGLDPARAHLHGRSLAPLWEGARTSAAPIFSWGGIQPQESIEHEGWKLIRSAPARGPYTLLYTHPRARERAAEVELRVQAVLAEREEPADSMEMRAILGDVLRDLLQDEQVELYHLERDPLELHDLAAEQPERVNALLRLLDRERARAEAARVHGAEDGLVQRLDEAALRELADLGYGGD